MIWLLNVINIKDFTAVSKGTTVDEFVNIEEVCRELQSSIDKSNDISIVNINGDNEISPTIFSEFNNEYTAQKYVGILEYEGNKIVIGSRFDFDNSQFFLQYVFSKAFDMQGKIFEDMNLFGKSEKTWDILLVIIFARELKIAMKKGLFRMYRNYKNNDFKVRGQIDIARHIKLNMINSGKVAYNSREYSIDNYYNYLFLSAYDIIDKKYPNILKKLLLDDDNVKNGINTLKAKLTNIYKSQDILKNTSKKIVHPLYRKYENLRKTSIVILRKMGINAMNNDSTRVTGFVIDMTKLWEQFLEKTMFKKIELNNYTISQESFLILNGKRTIQPDFYWKNKGLVIDAKYKRSWGLTLNNDWQYVREDVFQVLSYILSLKCRIGAVVFPTELNIPFSYDEKLSVFPDGSLNRYFFRLPYFIKKANSYEEFSKNMALQENIIISAINKYLF